MSLRNPGKWLLSAGLFLLVVLAFQGGMDSAGRTYTEQGFKRALITYGIARGLNGVISVAQGTEVSLQPAGVGVTLTPGQILDPVNDLIERFSWIMLASSSSLGVQRLLIDIASWPGFSLLLALLAMAVLLIWWLPRFQHSGARLIATRVMVFLLLVRFAVPFIAVVNEALYEQFLKDHYELSLQQLEQTTAAIGTLQHPAPVGSDAGADVSLLEKAQRLLASARQSADVDARIEQYREIAANAVTHTINMIVIFALQTILFPLFFLWLLLRLARAMLFQQSS